MLYDTQRIDDAVLALLAAFCDDTGRSWKGHDWDVMNRLHAEGWISDPISRAKSVCLTGEGRARGERLAEALFGSSPPHT